MGILGPPKKLNKYLEKLAKQKKEVMKNKINLSLSSVYKES